MTPYYETELGKLYHGDCLEIMPQLEPVDLVLTDPPYDKDTHKGGMFTGEIKFGNVDFPSINIIPIIGNFLKASNRWVLVFTPIETLGEIKNSYKDSYIRGGVWDRIVNSPQISGDRPAQGGEGIAILHCPGKKQWNGGGKAGIWRAMVERNKKQHPTQKPLKLLNELVGQFSNTGETVLDPFLGSGTTAIACERLKRKWIGIEIEEKYCEISAKRIEAERKQLKLF